ncbi:Hypothetical predicted protein [Xyrichtys novacula]|uniref:Uncharacterized protein n=1 Tax=Xyrichtys novacula TaxID=13765 RepID=A0AAV1HBJ6_XYRNO|nr:Hypothetical predicted protein [Xyrichtys novacula]
MSASSCRLFPGLSIRDRPHVWKVCCCYLMNGSGLRQAEMGVFEASLPRLTAQELLWSARHAPPDNNPSSLTSDNLRLSPAERRKRKVTMRERPVCDVHVFVCVRVCRTLIMVSAQPGAFPAEQSGDPASGAATLPGSSPQ